MGCLWRLVVDAAEHRFFAEGGIEAIAGVHLGNGPQLTDLHTVLPALQVADGHGIRYQSQKRCAMGSLD